MRNTAGSIIINTLLKREATKRMIIFTLILLCFALPSFAQNYLLIHHTSSTLNIEFNSVPNSPGHFQVIENGTPNPSDYTSIGPIIVDGGGTLNIEFNTTEPVPLYNVSATTYQYAGQPYSMHGYQFWVLKGTLNLSLGSGYTSTTTLRRTDNVSNSTSPREQVFRVSSNDVGGANCKLTVTGSADHHFVVDGAANFYISGSNAGGWSAVPQSGYLPSRGALLAVFGNNSYHGGTVELEYVDFINNWNRYQTETERLSTGLGGAVHLVNGTAGYANTVINLTMKHCTIEKCYAQKSGAAMFIQGVYNSTASTVTMEDCVTKYCFTACTDADGLKPGYGGTYRTEETSSGPNFNITMKRCSIIGNASANWAGAICYNLPNELKLDTCRISGNYGAAGGLYCLGPTKLDSCSIKNNYATSNGGGMYCGASIEVNNSIIKNNSATSSGGGLYCNAATEVNGCTITGNSATSSGGGLYCNAATELNDCTITSNSATSDGGGLYCNAATEVNDCTITGNSATSSGGGVCCDATTLAVNGCTITGNSATVYGGGIYMGSTGEGGNGEVTVTGTVIVDDNHIVGSSTENNLYVGQSNWRVVYIGPEGLDCGSSIGISNRASGNFFGQCKGSTAVATVNGSNAYRNHYFFHDPGTCMPVNSADPYPTHPSAPYYDGYGGYLWFYDMSIIASNFDSWHDQSATEGTDYVMTDGLVSEVKTAAGLAYFSKHVLTNDYDGKTVTLSNSISLYGHNWEPIGYNAGCTSDAHPFKGTFDGKGHAITDMNCPFQYADVGLFGYVQGGTLKNIIVGGSINAIGATNAGGVVGQLDGGSVYNCYSYVELTGSENATLAGVVGNLVSGSLENSFANPKFTVSSGSGLAGGLVGVNTGKVENCYVRLSRTQSLGSAHFGMLAGSNTGTNTIVQCYAPDGASSQFNHSYTYLYNNVSTGLQNCDLYKKADTLYLYKRTNGNLVGSTGKTLTVKLNEWVSSKYGSNANLAYWKRTTAGGYSYTYGSPSVTYTGGNINDDYPIHKMKDLACAASTDGLLIEYSRDLGTMLTKYNGLTGGGTLWLYATPKNSDGTDERVNVANDSDVLLYIDEDAALLQASGNSLTAYTGQTLRTATSSRWHFISSSLTNSDIGFNYASDNVDFSWDSNPCGVTFNGNNDDALFPSDMPNITKVDLYTFYEPAYHWLNLKRNTNSHWHMDDYQLPITYNGNGTGSNGNETYLVPGKGYLASIDKDQLLQNKGTLNNIDVTLQNVTKTDAVAWAGLLGYNLLGNPYQSYLDFDAFISDNSGLTSAKGNAEPTYAVYDPEIGSYIQYKAGSSRGSRSADGMIHPHQGFMIRNTGSASTAVFKNTMRHTNSTSPFRGEQPAYPLVNLTVTDIEGNADVAVLELGRDTDAGAEKLRANTCKGWLYLHHNDDDYGILFRTEVEDYQPLWFETSETGTYTLSWETANAQFDQLTLIDNITGEVTDMLTHDSYMFEANPDQYKSRFKIVVGDWKDVEENEGGASTGSAAATFAYYANGEIHLVETQNFASLQIVDMMGRVIATCDGRIQCVPTNGMAPGVYILRLTDNNGTRTQKIVIE